MRTQAFIQGWMLHDSGIGDFSPFTFLIECDIPGGMSGLTCPFSVESHLALCGFGALFLMIRSWPSWTANACGMNWQHGWSITISGLAGLSSFGLIEALGNG